MDAQSPKIRKKKVSTYVVIPDKKRIRHTVQQVRGQSKSKQ